MIGNLLKNLDHFESLHTGEKESSRITNFSNQRKFFDPYKFITDFISKDFHLD